MQEAVTDFSRFSPPTLLDQLKHVSGYASQPTFRHSVATHPAEDGYDIRAIHELLGDKDVRTTMTCAHVLHKGGTGNKRPG